MFDLDLAIAVGLLILFLPGYLYVMIGAYGLLWGQKPSKVHVALMILVWVGILPVALLM